MSGHESGQEFSDGVYDDDGPMSSAPSQSQQQHSSIALDSDQTARAPAPIQKRRRVTRACDECRRKKIKCDGKQPCTHCTVYSYGEINSDLNNCLRSCG